MKRFKLDNIDKRDQVFKVPDGYFEDLPMKIQSRIEQKKKAQWVHSPVVKLAFSVVAVLIIVVSIVLMNNSQSAEDILAGISQEDLIAYVDQLQLDETDILMALENDFETFEFSSEVDLDELQLEDVVIEDVFEEYDLSEEYL